MEEIQEQQLQEEKIESNKERRIVVPGEVLSK